MVLFLPIKMKGRLDLVTKPPAIGRGAVAAILLLVHVASATTLPSCKPHSIVCAQPQTHTSVELVLCVALVDFRHKVGRAPPFTRLWVETRGDANVASATTSSREVSVDGLALDAFANDSTIGIDMDIRTDVTRACS